jgi:hypothetical protein
LRDDDAGGRNRLLGFIATSSTRAISAVLVKPT